MVVKKERVAEEKVVLAIGDINRQHFMFTSLIQELMVATSRATRVPYPPFLLQTIP